MRPENTTVILEFILIGFSGGLYLQMISFTIVLLAFVVILFGNLMMIVIICRHSHLHLPMYLFLVCLSLMETLTNIILVPGIMSVILFRQTVISKAWCFTQGFFYVFLAGSGFPLLSVMSFDRYVAVCQPLRYSLIMRKEVCLQLMLGPLVLVFSFLLFPIVIMSNATYCGNVLDHLVCEGSALMRLICTDTSLLKLYGLISSCIILIGPLILTSVSYILIVSTAIRLPSDTGRQKTFSTCISHLIMVSIVFGSAIFLEVRPPKYRSVEANKVVSLTSTMIAPLANPFVYTLRNQSVKDAIRKSLRLNKILS